MTFDPRHQSRVLLDGSDRAAARSYFKAVGFTDEDLTRPLIGVAHCWIEITPCNWNHRKMAEKVKEGKGAYGFDADKEEYTDMIEAGIIDPTKVVRLALKNAASVSSLMITTEAAVAEKPKKEPAGAPPPPAY